MIFSYYFSLLCSQSRTFNIWASSDSEATFLSHFSPYFTQNLLKMVKFTRITIFRESLRTETDWAWFEWLTNFQGKVSRYTLPRKNMNLPYSIRMYWTNFWQPTVHVKQNIFEKNVIKVGSSHLYASFGTFCVQIGQFLEAQWVFFLFENGQIAVFEGKCRQFRNLPKV